VTAPAVSRPSVGPNEIVVATVVVAGALGAWIVVVARMRGMDAGPGTDLGGLTSYVGIWVTMTAAMMLPSVAPTLVLYTRLGCAPGAAGPWIFVAGYLVVWTAFGLAAYALDRLVVALHPGMLAWQRGGAVVAGGAVAAAGLYELTPLKRVCLRRCRSPLAALVTRGRRGRLGALRMGVDNGAYCVGCCWGLMAILFALGVMSLLWMVVLSVVIFAQKVLPPAERLAVPLGATLVAFGCWVALAPDRVPGLTRPGGEPGMRMHMKMGGRGR
jgi:predicted metal-binding membrane protein